MTKQHHLRCVQPAAKAAAKRAHPYWNLTALVLLIIIGGVWALGDAIPLLPPTSHSVALFYFLPMAIWLPFGGMSLRVFNDDIMKVSLMIELTCLMTAMFLKVLLLFYVDPLDLVMSCLVTLLMAGYAGLVYWRTWFIIENQPVVQRQVMYVDRQ